MSHEPSRTGMNHLDENILELFVLHASEVKSARNEIQKHLDECVGCSALHKEISEYYREVDKLRHAREHPALLAETFAVKKRGTEFISTFQVTNVFPRLWGAVQRYPVGSSLVSLALVGLFALLLFRSTSTKSLAYARAKDEFLIAYDDRGGELWRKHIGAGFIQNREGLPATQRIYLELSDIEKNGNNDVVVTFGGMVEHYSNTIICYRHDGSERWRYALNRSVSFGNTTFSDEYVVGYLAVGDFDHNGIPEVVAYAQHREYYPSVIFKLDARSGTLLGEYWNCGWLESVVHYNLKGDGNEEFAFGGVNNSFGLASLVVIDPRFLSGAAPTTPDFAPRELTASSELAYLLFQKTQLAELESRNARNRAFVWHSQNFLQVRLVEMFGDIPKDVAYLYFDSTLTCVQVGHHDDFDVAYEKSKRAGKRLKPLSEIYEDLQKGISYWDGKEFVQKPTWKTLSNELTGK